MSHFAVMIIHKEDEDIDDLLQPYHEFECTGIDDQYVKDVDITDEAREAYEKDTEKQYKDPQGVLHYPYLDCFYRDPTDKEIDEIDPLAGTGCCGDILYTSKDWNDGRGYRPKIHFIPDGWEEIEVLVSDTKTFAEYVKDYYGTPIVKISQTVTEDCKYGYVLTDDNGDVVKVINRTNPNAKWDCWEVGGRYSGKLLVKAGANGDKGNSGALGTQYDSSGLDVARIGDLDFPKMLQRNIDKVNGRYKEDFEALRQRNPDEAWLHASSGFAVWCEMLGKRQDALTRLRQAWENNGKDGMFYKFINNSVASNSDAEYVRETDRFDGSWRNATVPLATALLHEVPLTAFAIIKDGEWYERGKMGWWGMISDEKHLGEWNQKVSELLQASDPDMIVSIVDCHI
jgi:hypothetical protein